ncbi:NlpC/P60 family protein [Mitsuaria sp. 7]|uniref:C40 family peptidase n=1 Tax=Mitsuaria sp. 7 TaxID=1658665 RepID=UPI000ADFE433|nr:NlpC/P60 family protein [Mitsuaria sp. 7]
MAALGLICVVASGSCWAQQSTSSTNESHDKPKAQAKAAPAKAAAKPAAKKTAEAKLAAKTSKDGKSSKQATAKDAGKDKKAKGDEDKSPATEVASDKSTADKTVSDKSSADKAASDKVASAKPETKAADKPTPAKADAKVAEAKTESAPPAGTMMGAYGQSLMRSPAGAAAVATTVAAAGTAAALIGPASPATVTNTALPPTALMGAAAGNANASESVARFLQQRGIVAQAQSTPASPGADAPAPGLLNRVRDNASDLVLSAMNFLGVPYKRGGNSVSNGFDCSGFTRHIFEMSVGLVLPRRADEQAKLSSLVPIKKEDLKPGDLVFFNTMRATFSHVGIYVGEGKFIHSPRVGGAVRVEDMREAYWAKRFTGARRADLNQANPGT